jgi:hypothetical protein
MTYVGRVEEREHMGHETDGLETATPGRIGGLGGDVTLADLFDDEWVSAHTDASSIAEFVASCEHEVTDQSSFEEIPEEEWDDYVAAHSEFADWGEMLSAAVEEYVAGVNADDAESELGAEAGDHTEPDAAVDSEADAETVGTDGAPSE